MTGNYNETNMTHYPSNLLGILQNGSTLNNYLSQTQIHDTLTLFIESLLPKLLHGQVKVSHIKEDQLILATHHTSIATRVRFYIPALLQELALFPLEKKITNIKISNYAPIKLSIQEKSNVTTTIMRQLSDSAAESIRKTAESVTDEELKNALYKLSENATKFRTEPKKNE